MDPNNRLHAPCIGRQQSGALKLEHEWAAAKCHQQALGGGCVPHHTQGNKAPGLPHCLPPLPACPARAFLRRQQAWQQTQEVLYPL